jgi:mercuric ion transport protein
MNTPASPSGRKPNGAGPVVLAAGGLIAGLATASCCALPLLLASLGLGSAWLFRLAVLAAPHRTALLFVGAAAIVAAALLLWRQRTQVCEPGALCAKPGVRITTIFGLVLGLILLIAGYRYV